MSHLLVYNCIFIIIVKRNSWCMYVCTAGFQIRFYQIRIVNSMRHVHEVIFLYNSFNQHSYL